MVIEECDEVKTLIDKKFPNGFVPKGTNGVVMLIVTTSTGKTGYVLEIGGINDEDPIFGYDEGEIELVKKFKMN